MLGTQRFSRTQLSTAERTYTFRLPAGVHPDTGDTLPTSPASSFADDASPARSASAHIDSPICRSAGPCSTISEGPATAACTADLPGIEPMLPAYSELRMVYWEPVTTTKDGYTIWVVARGGAAIQVVRCETCLRMLSKQAVDDKSQEQWSIDDIWKAAAGPPRWFKNPGHVTRALCAHLRNPLHCIQLCAPMRSRMHGVRYGTASLHNGRVAPGSVVGMGMMVQLGNLYQNRMLTEKIMHGCITELLTEVSSDLPAHHFPLLDMWLQYVCAWDCWTADCQKQSV